MKKIRLTEKDLQRIVKRVIKEHNDNEVGEYINEIAGGELKPDEKNRVIDAILDSSDDYTREELEKLSLKDLLNATKKSYDYEKEMEGEKKVNPFHQPITIEYLRKEVEGFLRDNIEEIEELPSDKMNMMVDEIAKEILKDVHYNIEYLEDRYCYIIGDYLGEAGLDYHC